MKPPKDSPVTHGSSPSGHGLGETNPGPPKSAGGKAGKTAFDEWLKISLHKLYDDVASEPVPHDLLRMIQEDRKK